LETGLRGVEPNLRGVEPALAPVALNGKCPASREPAGIGVMSDNPRRGTPILPTATPPTRLSGSREDSRAGPRVTNRSLGADT